MRALSVANVDTVIVFRSCTPLAVCLLDWLFLGRAFPSVRSLVSLSGIVLGSLGYVLNDKDFQVRKLFL
jgi:GDP-mannose transporter